VLAGLDWRTREDLVEFLEELRQSVGLTIVFCTPLPELCFRVADRMAILNAGKIIATGTPVEIETMNDPVIEDVFLSHFEAMRQFGRGAERDGPDQVSEGGSP
jgi:ABC-type multidrug transport system ATPase subunit